MKKLKQSFSLVMAILMFVSSISVNTVSVTAAEENTNVLVDLDTQWRYLDDNTDPAGSEERTSWTLASYDDSSWNSGSGKFGSKKGALDLGGGFIADVLLNQYIENTTTNIPAFFFRTTFTLDSLEDFAQLVGELQYDDAAIVYINGNKVGEFDVPEGGFSTNLEYGGSNATDPKPGTFVVEDTSLLIEGENVLAIEIHQGSATSSDIFLYMKSLELKLTTDAKDGFDRMEAEQYNSWSAGNLKTEQSQDASGVTLTNVGGTYDTAWLGFHNRSFLEEPLTVTIRYVNNSSRCAADANIEIRLGSYDGELLQTVELPATGNSWNEYLAKTITLENTDKYMGTSDLFFVMKGTTTTNPYIMNLDYIQFNNTLKATTQKAISLSMGSDETKRNITWYADEENPGKLQIAAKSDMIGSDFPVAFQEYTASIKATNDIGYYSNKLTISDLKADTQYVYRLLNGETVSEIYSFKTGSGENFNFLLVGDPQIGASGNISNDTNGWGNALTKGLTQFLDTDFIVSAGDQVDTASSESQYAGYLEHDSLTSMPIATVIGNHDTSNAAYSQHFNNPNVSTNGASTAGSDYWYVYNNVLFLNINSNNMSTAEHKAFMEEAISANPNVNWKVVVFHHSIYSVASHATESDILQRRNALVPVFKELDIDVVFMGHDHVYVRSYMMDGLTPIVEKNEDGSPLDQVVNPDGILYVTTNSSSGSKYYNIQSAAFEYSAVQSQEKVPNISNVEITTTSFKITTYRTTDMSIVDTFEIKNKTEVTGIITPNSIIGVANGTEKTAQALGLPNQVTMVTSEGNVQAEVEWLVEASDYDQSIEEEQTFQIEGIVTLPEGVDNPNQVDLNITIHVTVNGIVYGDGNLIRVVTPSAIIGVTNGTDKTAQALGMPGTVLLITENGNVQGEVFWDVEASSYEPNITEEQSFTVNGYVTLPVGIFNPDNVDLMVTIHITVNAGVYGSNNLIRIVTPSAITGLINGTAKTPDALRLPVNVTLVTDNGNIQAAVNWEVAASTYNPSLKSAQTFTVIGVVVLPEGVDNPDNINLLVSINVTVNKKSSSSGSGTNTNSGGDNGNTVVETTQEKLEESIMAKTEVTPTVDKMGHATVNIPEATVIASISKALEEAKQAKNKEGINVAIAINMPSTAKSLDIVLTQPTLKKLTDSKVQHLEVDGSIIMVDFDEEAIKEIKKQSVGDVTISVTPVEKLAKQAQELIGDRPIYNINIHYVKSKKTQSITDLNSGISTLAIPYTPSKGEVVSNLYAAYVDNQGELTLLKNSGYDKNGSRIIFNTNHFSMYGVAYESTGKVFTDIKNHWAKESIDYVVSRGILDGISKTIFSTDRAMSLGMFVTALGKLANADVSSYKTSSFADVSKNSDYMPYIEWAYDKKIISSAEDNQVAPDRTITREEMAVILTNYGKATGFDLPITRVSIDFSDNNKIGSKAKDAVKAVQQAGIMDGVGNNLFNPQADVTYGETAMILHRYIMLTISSQTAQGWAYNDDGQRIYYKDGKIQSAWQLIENKWYYFLKDGSLVVNTSIGAYQVDNDGARITQ